MQDLSFNERLLKHFLLMLFNVILSIIEDLFDNPDQKTNG